MTVILNVQSTEFEQHEVTRREAIENAIRLCAGLFDSTLNAGMPLRFMCNGTLTKGSREPIETAEYWGREHVEGLLQMLAKLQLHSTEDFSSYLDNIFSEVTSTDIIIVTAFVSEGLLDFASRKEQAGTNVKILTLTSVPERLDSGRHNIVFVDFDKEDEHED